MRSRKRGERNWEGLTGDYELHIPPPTTLEQLDDPERTKTGIIMICGREYLRAADGRLEPVDHD